MNIFDLFYGRGNKFDLILKALSAIEREITGLSNEHVAIQIHLDEIDGRLKAMQAQLDRIENAVSGGGQAATLTIVVGTPTEQE